MDGERSSAGATCAHSQEWRTGRRRRRSWRAGRHRSPRADHRNVAGWACDHTWTSHSPSPPASTLRIPEPDITMANHTLLAEPGATRTRDRPPHPGEAVGGPGFDWLMTVFGVWLLGGLYLDGWAHIHVPGL